MLKFNNAAAPKVLGTLLDLDCDDVYIDLLLKSIRMCPIGELVEEFDQRSKRKDLQNWLQARANEGVQDPPLHNAIAMNLIDHDSHEAENFLINNPYYDSKVVGKYADNRMVSSTASEATGTGSLLRPGYGRLRSLCECLSKRFCVG